MDIGKGLRFIRVAAGLQQKDLAQRLGISQNYLSLLENNKAEPSLSLLRKVSDEFDIPTSFLLWEENAVDKEVNPEIREHYERLRQLIHELQQMRVDRKQNERVAGKPERDKDP